jgi:hypothetical protein
MCNVKSKLRYTDQTRRGGRGPICTPDASVLFSSWSSSMRAQLAQSGAANGKSAAALDGPNGRWSELLRTTENTTNQGEPATEEVR